MASGAILAGKSVLIVEDEVLIAFLLEDMLDEMGAAAVAHETSLKTALAHLDRARPDICVLDVNLGEEKIYPLAERLSADGIGFVFVTGYGRMGVDPRWAQTPVVQKPVEPAALALALAEVLARPA